MLCMRLLQNRSELEKGWNLPQEAAAMKQVKWMQETIGESKERSRTRMVLKKKDRAALGTHREQECRIWNGQLQRDCQIWLNDDRMWHEGAHSSKEQKEKNEEEEIEQAAMWATEAHEEEEKELLQDLRVYEKTLGDLQEQRRILNQKKMRNAGNNSTDKQEENSEEANEGRRERLFRLLKISELDDEVQDEVDEVIKMIQDTRMKLGSGFNLYGKEGPEELVATFHKLFDGKIKETKAMAAQAAKRYGLLPELML